jgi:hypothetical protein
MFYDFEEEDYTKACRAWFQRCQRRIWVYMQPNRYESEMTKEGLSSFSEPMMKNSLATTRTNDALFL